MVRGAKRSGVTQRSARAGGLVVALGLGAAVATGHGVAWADDPGTDSTGGSPGHSVTTDAHDSVTTDAHDPSTATAHSSPTDVAPPSARSAGPRPGADTSSKSGADEVGEAAVVDSPAAPRDSKPSTSRHDSTAGSDATATGDDGDTATVTSTVNASTPATATPVVNAESHPPRRVAPKPSLAPVAKPEPASTESEVAAASAMATTSVVTHDFSTKTEPSLARAAVSTTAVPTPSVPAPLSPIAAILALPGQLVNAVLGIVGVTPAAGTTPTPFSPAPIVQLVWEAFRRFETIAGLDVPPSVQPVLHGLMFTGSLTTPTPTVAQFLDAATAEYALGSTPGGLTPLTLKGFPVAYTNVFSGASAQVWVTPQDQVIIAYQGTTGGTNLLFNPLIAISQVLADAQGVLTGTTPMAFTDSLAFARYVQAEAAAQGYPPDSIFVTGHSLGGWEAEYVAQNTGLAGIGFESLGLSTTVAGNGADSLFVNVATWGDPASFAASDLPGMLPFAPAYVPGGGSMPHYGPIVLLGDPASQVPLTNAAALWNTSLVGDLVFVVTALAQFLEYHLPGVQAYSLDVDSQPDLLPGTGIYAGPVYTGYGELSIPEFLLAASTAGILFEP